MNSALWIWDEVAQVERERVIDRQRRFFAALVVSIYKAPLNIAGYPLSFSWSDFRDLPR
jgi:hypothetical protein